MFFFVNVCVVMLVVDCFLFKEGLFLFVREILLFLGFVRVVILFVLGLVEFLLMFFVVNVCVVILIVNCFIFREV